MKTYERIEQLLKDYPSIAQYMLKIHSPESDLDFYSPEFRFHLALGGDVLVVETPSEAHQEIDNQLFDVIEDLDGYRLYWLANNNAGGPSYFVPMAFVTSLQPDPDSNIIENSDPILSVIPTKD
jgi:hypothetical protein